MSVVGIDLGTQYSKVAVAYRKKISMVPNEQSKFETPTLVGFTEKQREIGDAAETTFNRNFKNTVCQVKRYLGRHFDDPTIADELRKWNYCKVNPSEDNKIAFEVMTAEGPKELVPEQVLCAFIRQLKEFTVKYLDGLPVKDCVITCPSYFTDAQRRVIIAAANLAELSVLRLLNETTAIAISYGLFRTLEEERRIMFVDIGFSNTQVFIADIGTTQLEMYAGSYDAFLGARDFDLVLFDHFRKQIETTHRVDLTNEPRARFRLMKGVERVKKLLTGNKDAVFLLECLVNEIDFTLRITREEFDNLCAPLLVRLSQCVENAVAEMRMRDRIKFPTTTGNNANPPAKVPIIHSVEITGGASRIRCVQDGLVTIVKKLLPECNIDKMCTTLNSDECVARGAALMCAMLSPIFKVREFQVKDMNNWPVLMTYPSSALSAVSTGGNDLTRQIVLQRHAPCPCTAKVTFYNKEPFKIVLEHPKDEVKLNDTDTLKVEYPMKHNLVIGEFNIETTEFSPNAVKEPQIKLSISLNKHSLLEMPQAELIEFVKKEEPKPEPTADKPGDKPANNATTNAPPKETTNETKTGNAQTDANKEKQPEEQPQQEKEPQAKAEEKDKATPENKTNETESKKDSNDNKTGDDQSVKKKKDRKKK